MEGFIGKQQWNQISNMENRTDQLHAASMS
jgi:hypothetical protein